MHPFHVAGEVILTLTPFSFLSAALTQKITPLYDGRAPGALGDKPEDIPTLTWFYPKQNKATDSAIVICPGGGYGGLADHEGQPIAEWLNSLGVTAVVLKYRLGPKYHHPIMLQDAARAIRVVRSKASELHLASEKIGVLGFSAGGHLASSIATHFDDGNPQGSESMDRISSRPNIAILIYPVITMTHPSTHEGTLKNLLGDNPPQNLKEFMSSEKSVTSETPPTFLVASFEDTGVPMENSMMFAEALREKGVPLELHVYESGPHGFGLGDNKHEYGTWPMLCANWLKVRGFLK